MYFCKKTKTCKASTHLRTAKKDRWEHLSPGALRGAGWVLGEQGRILGTYPESDSEAEG